MKNMYHYQISEFDCGPTSLINSLIYLYNREEIPAYVIKAIFNYTLDCFDDNGKVGQLGTSLESMRMIGHWLNDYSRHHQFKINCNYYELEAVTFERIDDCIKNNGCVVLRTYLEEDHYVTVTNIDQNYVYIIDPYYLTSEYKDEAVLLCEDKTYNRKVNLDRFKSDLKLDFALGPVNKRQMLTINK